MGKSRVFRLRRVFTMIIIAVLSEPFSLPLQLISFSFRSTPLEFTTFSINQQWSEHCEVKSHTLSSFLLLTAHTRTSKTLGALDPPAAAMKPRPKKVLRGSKHSKHGKKTQRDSTVTHNFFNPVDGGGYLGDNSQSLNNTTEPLTPGDSDDDNSTESDSGERPL